MVGESYTLQQYQNDAVALRRNTVTEGWETLNAEIVPDEALELLSQHGDSMAVLAPSYVWNMSRVKALEPKSLYGMADELGDVLWGAADTAERAGITLSDATRFALFTHTGDDMRVSTFAELSFAAVTHARRITVPSKHALVDPETPGLTNYSLAESPFSVFMRTILRVSKSLQPDLKNDSQPSAIDFEAPRSLGVSLGELLLSATYVAEARMGISAELVARFNTAKLQHRAIRGKENDLDPVEFFTREVA